MPRVGRVIARRLLLDAQGLLHDPALKPTPARALAVIERMGFVQIDSINTVERAHHLTLASRFDDYAPSLLSKHLEGTRALFEHWTHDASAIPTRWFPHWNYRFDRQRERIHASKWWRDRIGERPEPLLERVERRIEEEGPLLAKDVFEEGETEGKSGGWWEWRPEKAALEYLWHTGRLAVARRVSFQKVYDLTRRVLPDHHALPRPEREGHLDWVHRTALERLGIATPTELAAFWGLSTIAEAAAWCAQRARLGDGVVQVELEGAEGAAPRVCFAVADWEARAREAPDPPDQIRLLSPFDPICRDRKRALALFGFDYRFEAFVPAKKRKYGYYVLPMLEGDRLIGRIEPKMDRSRSVLEVLGTFWEPGVKPTRERRARLQAALERLARLVGASSIEHRRR